MGANTPDSPFIGGDYWFFISGLEAETAKLPLLAVFLTGVATWSEATPVPAQRM